MSYEVKEEKRMELAKLLKDAREDRGLKINQLALKTNVNKSLISRIEKGALLKINPFLLKKLSIGLKINYLEIFKLVGYIDEKDFSEDGKLNVIEGVNEETELSEFTELLTSLPEEDLKGMLQTFLDKKILEAVKTGTYEEKKEEFEIIRQAIESGVEEG